METESKEKVKTKRNSPKKQFTLTIQYPRPVHIFMLDFQRKISYERGKKFNIEQAYIEYLLEKTQQPS